jgi:hypothetical protein
MRTPAIVVDIDGTLSSVERRKDLIKTGDWEQFHVDAPKEDPNAWCLEIVHRFTDTHKILVVTGRPETCYDETNDWLMTKCDLRPSDYELLMAPPGMMDVDYKSRVYREHIEPQYDVLFVIDDRPQVVEKWRSLGLTCLQPNFIPH